MSGTDPRSVAQWTEARRWFAKAIEDLQVANLAMTTTPPLVEPAAYHCEQTAEKLFKGLLVLGNRRSADA
jgi:HEPN domain-containing protein